MTDAEYRSAEGVSNTMLGHLDKSPAHLQSYLTAPPKETDELRLGRIFHAALLEPETAWRNVAIKELDGRTAEGKAWAAENSGKVIISKQDRDNIMGMVRAVCSNSSLYSALETGKKEQPLFADFSLGGTVKRKGKLDLLTAGSAIVDFKSTTNASKDAFSKAIANYGYARQAAYYLDLAKDNGLPHTEFVFVAVEKERPFCVGIYQLDHDSIQWGRKKYIDLLTLYMRCRDENNWPGYTTEPQIISLPQWAMREQAA